jgi:hypothetical protein
VDDHWILVDCPEAFEHVTVERPVCLECDTPSTIFEHATMHSDGVPLETDLLLSPEIPKNGSGVTNPSGTESLSAAAAAKGPTNEYEDTPTLLPLESSVPTLSSSEMKGKSKALPSSSSVQTTSDGKVPPSTPSKLLPAPKGPSSNQPILTARFSILLGILKEARANGCLHVSRSDLGTILTKHRHVYKQASVAHFKAYVTEAERAGIVELGGKGNKQWIALHRNWW